MDVNAIIAAGFWVFVIFIFVASFAGRFRIAQGPKRTRRLEKKVAELEKRLYELEKRRIAGE